MTKPPQNCWKPFEFHSSIDPCRPNMQQLTAVWYEGEVITKSFVKSSFGSRLDCLQKTLFLSLFPCLMKQLRYSMRLRSLDFRMPISSVSGASFPLFPWKPPTCDQHVSLATNRGRVQKPIERIKLGSLPPITQRKVSTPLIRRLQVSSSSVTDNH